MVGVSGLEPEASWSRTKHATSCATPRYLTGTFEIIAILGYKVKAKFYFFPSDFFNAEMKFFV